MPFNDLPPLVKQVVACDRCIDDQVRCRFNPLHQSSCRGCVALAIPCNWTRAVKPQPPPDISYVKYLESRARLLETHLKNLLPGVNNRKNIEQLLDQETAGATQDSEAISASSGHLPEIHKSAPGTNFLGSPALAQLVQRMRLLDAEPGQSIQDLIDDNVLWVDASSTQFERLFHGYSSAHILSRDAIEFRHDINGSQHLPNFRRAHTRSGFLGHRSDMKPHHESSSNAWVVEHSIWELPPDDLMPTLLDAYFDNTFFPVVHRPLFEKQLREELHKREPAFLRLVLLVCANGAKWCDDPRVVDGRWPVSLSAGYRWLKQLELWPRNLLTIPRLTLWDAQGLVILALYLCGSSATYGAWTMIGLGIRRMQDIGSHRMRSPQTLESELHKRCFWWIKLFRFFIVQRVLIAKVSTGLCYYSIAFIV
ncbi:unnamed protein product [Rhizoctonia solani]|uniref:Xylanolytic transcriptional activator regulatory domain-containing protein n=1 Tax=Rhizoctonia solani TaxID=456999 RepID=A0A8H3GRT4_9AGAM|nr:unnamed protein product [Rhizoctonia solani]